MSVREGIKEGWAMAAGRPSVRGQLRAYEVGSAKPGAKAVVAADGRLGILLTLDAAEHLHAPKALQHEAGSALAAEVATFVEGGVQIRALVVWCPNPLLSEVFLSFCEALIERWAAGIGVADALKRCLAEFRELLAYGNDGDTSTLIGLLGELIVLDDLLARSPAAFEAWCGQEGDRHDFRRGSIALETKTTLRSDESSLAVHISSIDQLQPPSGGVLFLHAVQLEHAQDGSVSFEKLCARIDRRLSGSALEAFRAFSALPRPARTHRTLSFAILSRRTYRVDVTFPRLTAERLSLKELDPGISKVRYELDLSAAAPFLVEFNVARDAIVQSE